MSDCLPCFRMTTLWLFVSACAVIFSPPSHIHDGVRHTIACVCVFDFFFQIRWAYASMCVRGRRVSTARIMHSYTCVVYMTDKKDIKIAIRVIFKSNSFLAFRHCYPHDDRRPSCRAYPYVLCMSKITTKPTSKHHTCRLRCLHFAAVQKHVHSKK